MSLLLNEDQQMLREAARNFCQKHTPLSQLRHLRDSRDANGYDPAVWRQMADLGWTGMAVAERYGGFEFGYAGLGIVLQETGRTLSSSPLIASILIGASLIERLGDEQIKQSVLPNVVSGETLLALALDEGPLHQPWHIRTTAVRAGEDYLLEGSKTFVLDGHVADDLLVVARSGAGETDRQGLSVFLVPAGTEGLSITRSFMVDSRNAAKIDLRAVRVPASALLGREGEAADRLEQVLDIARIGVASEMLGSMEETFSRTIEYLKQRQQFGVAIGAFQALQHRAAHMYSEIELCVSVVRAALAALDSKDRDGQAIASLASLAKAKLGEVSQLVSNEGIQMHGGIGMTDEFDLGFFIKRARVADQFLGDAAYHRDRYARLNGF